MDNLIKIGITGSYGKTTSKNILNDILNIKYNSFATPKSFNTPYGLMNAINNYLDNMFYALLKTKHNMTYQQYCIYYHCYISYILIY